MMDTLLLDAVDWDLVLDANGNIAVAGDPYSLAQDASSVLRTFQGEVYYDTTAGIAYLTDILGKTAPLALVQAAMQNGAMTVPDVEASVCVISGFEERRIVGQVQVTSAETGQTAVATFAVTNPQGA